MKKNYADLAETAIHSIEKVAGTHPGYRRAHARGSCYEAVFSPNGEAAAFTTAAHLQRKPVQAIVRFSDSSPNPHLPDGLSPIKGMSVQFQLPSGETTCLVGVTAPVFLTKTPEAFVEIIRGIAENPGPRTFVKMLLKYPESKAAFRIIRHLRPFVSYSTSHYYPIHAFYFINEAGVRQPVKYEWVPEKELSFQAKREAAGHPADYLENELDQELPVRFTLQLILGEEGDPAEDSTASWPAERTRVPVGRLEIKRKQQDTCDGLLFDPTVVPEGIECPADPVLHARHDLYAASFQRRVNGL